MKRFLSTTSLAIALGLAAPWSAAFAQQGGGAESAPAGQGGAAPAGAEAGARPRPVLGKSGGHGRAAFMASYDEDGDGAVARSDYFAIRGGRFDDADADRDGMLTEQEYVTEFEARLVGDYEAEGRERDEAFDRNMAQAADRFHLLDLDKDGKMDAGEFFGQANKTFRRIDTNGDGVVDAGDPAPVRRPPVTDADFSQITPFAGRIQASGPDGAPIHAGEPVELKGRGLTPGQSLTLQRGTTALNPDPIKVDDQGGFSLEFTLPEDAAPGLYPVFAIGQEPAAITSFDLKISPRIAASGEDGFQKAGVKGTAGLYQSAYSPASDALFVTATGFAGPQGGKPTSTLSKLSAGTLETLASLAIPASGDSVAAVFGIDVDDRQGTVWVTNTIQGTVAVYDQDDLSLVKQFEPGLIGHSREVVVDSARGRAFVSGSASNEIAVFDTAEPAYLTTVHVRSQQRGGEFTAMGLALDPGTGHVYAVSRTSREIAEIDPESGKVVRMIPVPGAANSAGIAFDAENGRLLVASQDSDDLVALEAQSGEVLFRTPVGAGPLAVAVDHGRAFVANRGAGTVAVVDPDGKIAANLPIGSFPNHVETDGQGNVFVINKARGPEDESGDHITRLH